jgi:hypothetical protein
MRRRLTEADRLEIIDSIKAELEYLKAEFIGVDPDWDPLHKLLPPEWWDGWMFMQRSGEIRCYKHGITRNYLNIDPRGRCWTHRGKRKGWVQVDPGDAVDDAYHGIERLGETRESKYDAAYRTRKYTALEAAGYTVIS